MRFPSRDTFDLSARYILGITDTQVVDPGGELTFRGIPYRQARWDLQLARGVPGMHGYSAKLTRIDHIWEPAELPGGSLQAVPYFDYRGLDSRFEYRYPLPSRNWVIGYGSVRRFNHYRPEGWTDEDGEPGEVGVPYRKEQSGSLEVGMRGYLGFEQPYFVRLGYGQFRYTGEEPSNVDFSGLVGQANWRLRVGGRSHLEVGWQRRPLPSSFSTYYVINEFRVRADREWLVYSRAGLDLLYSKNKYGEPLPNTACSDFIREDRRWKAEAYVDWLVHRKFGFRVAVGHHERTSNCQGSDYKANMVTTGMTLGWF
jgi:hypothetical protein